MKNGVQEVHGLTSFFQNLQGPLFEEFITTSRVYIYDLMCGLYAYDKLEEN